MMKYCLAAMAIVLASAIPGRAETSRLQLTIGNGRVTLIADQVSVREILAEWARQGRSLIVNAEKVTGAPVTLRLIDVPEAEALDVVLRSVSGYLAAQRATPVANASQFDRIMILASSRPTATGPPPAASPQHQPPQPFPNFPTEPPMMEGLDDQVDDDPNDPKPEVQLPVSADQPGPIPIGPPGEEMQPGQEQPMAPQPQLPITSPRPGLIVPPTQQPPQPYAQPPQPFPQPQPRPPGGDSQ